jgi:DNA-directed RNA polymerase beta subunit
MLTSNPLSSIPFVSSSDTTRLQMGAKQMHQCCTHKNCKRPYTIGSDYKYLTEQTKLFVAEAPSDGEIIFKNEDILIVYLTNINSLKLYEVPKYKHISKSFSSELRYIRGLGKFNQGDLLFEYDCFIEGIPAFGYSLETAFIAFGGFVFEDAVVISEKAADLMRVTKTEQLIIPIYTYSLFRDLYPNSKYKFLPEIGQTIADSVVSYQSIPKNDSDNYQLLKSVNLYNLAIDDNFLFNSIPLFSKLAGATVSKIKIHHINKTLRLMDEKGLGTKLKLMYNDYAIKTKHVYESLKYSFGEEYSRRIISNNYIMQTVKQEIENKEDLVFVIELELSKEYKTKVGDKISTRYAGKGVISKIIPNELRPINIHSGEPIDVILNPLGVFARMNFGVTIEGLINKVIKFCEKEILNNNFDILLKLIEINNIIKNYKYSKEIKDLYDNIIKNEYIRNDFLESIKKGGLYFECPSFTNFDLKELEFKIRELFNINICDKLEIKKETFSWLRDQVGLQEDVPLPKDNIIYESIYNAPIYIIKLEQLSESKLNCRDFGEYSAAKKIPIKDLNNSNKASKIGNMEFDALLAHNCINVIKELRTVKSDALNLKPEMVTQLISTGSYELPNTKPKSFTKDIIKAYVTFLNEN